MKRNILVLFGLLTFVSSCTHLLDVKPEDRQSITNAFDDDKELMAFLNTIQGEVQRLINYDPHQAMGAAASKSDNPSTNNLRNLVPATVKSSAFTSWKEYYDVVYLSNLILENISQAEGKIPAERINFYKGQAYFFRGWMYEELGKIWGNAIITKGINHFEANTNSKDYEVIDQAISDMQNAYQLLGNYGQLKDNNGSVLASKQYGSKGAAAAMLAHLYAWKGSMAELYKWQGVDAHEAYANSVKWSTTVISGDASAPYSLAPNIETLISQTFNSWMPATRAAATESILEVQSYYLADFSGGYAKPFFERYTTWPINVNHSTSTISTTQVAFKFLATDVNAMYTGNDQRRNGYFYKVDSMKGKGFLYSYPYKARKGVFRITNQSTGTTNMTGLDCNDIFFRLADIYLLRAECAAKLGDNGTAIMDLNKIRERAGADLYPTANDTDLKMSIFKEREKELLMEKNRFYDVLRNGKDYIKTQLSPAFATLTDQDMQDGVFYSYIGQGAFTNNTILIQNIYWNRVD